MHDRAPAPYQLNAVLAATAFVLAALMLYAVPLTLLLRQFRGPRQSNPAIAAE